MHLGQNLSIFLLSKIDLTLKRDSFVMPRMRGHCNADFVEIDFHWWNKTSTNFLFISYQPYHQQAAFQSYLHLFKF
jgi:hypothetical protein